MIREGRIREVVRREDGTGRGRRCGKSGCGRCLRGCEVEALKEGEDEGDGRGGKEAVRDGHRGDL